MEIIETPVFTRRIQALISEDEYRHLQLLLLVDPAVGVRIPDAHGLRKLRWAATGKGKRGGKGVCSMKEMDFKELVASVKQARGIIDGKRKPSRTFTYTPLKVRNIRCTLKQSQPAFAQMLGIKVATLRNWEQGRRVPDGPAQALLKVAASYPKEVLEVLLV